MASAAMIAAEMRNLDAQDRATEAELRRTLSQIERLQRGQSCEPEPEPEPEQEGAASDEDAAELSRTLTQEVFSRLSEHPQLSEAEREHVRALAAARKERMPAAEDDDEEEDDGAGTGLFSQKPSRQPPRTWSQERLDAASTELEALREIRLVRDPAAEFEVPLQRVDSQVEQASELERIWMEVATLREQLGIG